MEANGAAPDHRGRLKLVQADGRSRSKPALAGIGASVAPGALHLGPGSVASVSLAPRYSASPSCRRASSSRFLKTPSADFAAEISTVLADRARAPILPTATAASERAIFPAVASPKTSTSAWRASAVRTSASAMADEIDASTPREDRNALARAGTATCAVSPMPPSATAASAQTASTSSRRASINSGIASSAPTPMRPSAMTTPRRTFALTRLSKRARRMKSAR